MLSFPVNSVWVGHSMNDFFAVCWWNNSRFFCPITTRQTSKDITGMVAMLLLVVFWLYVCDMYSSGVIIYSIPIVSPALQEENKCWQLYTQPIVTTQKREIKLVRWLGERSVSHIQIGPIRLQTSVSNYQCGNSAFSTFFEHSPHLSTLIA